MGYRDQSKTTRRILLGIASVSLLSTLAYGVNSSFQTFNPNAAPGSAGALAGFTNVLQPNALSSLDPTALGSALSKCQQKTPDNEFLSALSTGGSSSNRYLDLLRGLEEDEDESRQCGSVDPKYCAMTNPELEIDELACSKVGVDEKTGKFSTPNTRAQGLLKKFKLGRLGACCRKRKLDAVNDKISCFKSQGAAIAQQIQALSQTLQTNYQQAEESLQTTNRFMRDRDRQLKRVDEMLKGDGTKSNPGFEGALEAVEAAYGRIDNEVTDLANKYESYRVTVKQHEDNQAAFRLSHVRSCLETQPTPVSAESCRGYLPGLGADEPITPILFARCKVVANVRGARPGRSGRGNVHARAEAEGRRAEQIMRSMVGGMPSEMQDVPVAGQGGGSSVPYRNWNEFYRRYKKQMRFSGYDATNFLRAEWSRCERYAQERVNAMESGTNYKTSETALETARSNISTLATNYLKSYKEVYSAGARLLANGNVSDDIRSCQGSSVSTNNLDSSLKRSAGQVKQIHGCMVTYKERLRGMLDGSNSTTVPLEIEGRKSIGTQTQDARYQQAISQPLTCSGLRGCITELKRFKTHVTQEQEGWKEYKLSAVRDVNRKRSNDMKAIQAQVSGAAAQLRRDLENIRSEMSKMGLDANFEIKTVEGSKPEVDKNTGLVMPPTNPLGEIGASIGLIDLDGVDFSDSNSSMSEKYAQYDSEMKTARSAGDQIQARVDECVKMGRDARKGEIQKVADEASGTYQTIASRASSCHKAVLCDRAEADSLGQLAKSLKNSDIIDVDTSLLTVLEGGLMDGNTCSPSDPSGQIADRRVASDTLCDAVYEDLTKASKQAAALEKDTGQSTSIGAGDDEWDEEDEDDE